MLRGLAPKSVYKSDQDNILEDFYMPALSVASSYDRAVGFFSGATISYAAQAISAFVRHSGSIRLIIGAFVDQQDIDAVIKGLADADVLAEGAGRQFLDEMDKVTDDLFQCRFEALAWLVSRGRLEIKVALRAHGMYHDKVGIISDASGDAIVFSGSANESLHALLPTHNYESIDVFPSWRPELRDYFDPHRESFERLWGNRSKNTLVVDVPHAVREKLLGIASTMQDPPDPDRENAIARLLAFGPEAPAEAPRGLEPLVPTHVHGSEFKIRDHQRDALNAWRVQGDFHGIFDLATGAGKTITAAYGIVQMAKAITGLTVVIAVPYQNLADQWCENLEAFNIYPLRCYVSRSDWFDELQKAVHDTEMGASRFTAIVVVNRTLRTDEFQAAMARLPGKQFLFIGDECHHHASSSYFAALPFNANYRMGLSATPEHYLDGDRNARLESYYGKKIFTYSLEQAITDHVLTPYNYFPHIVAMTDDEAHDFISLSAEIGRQMGRHGSMSDASEGLKALLMKRSRLVASAQNKIPALAAVVRSTKPEAHSLFYCGDGRVTISLDDETDGHEDEDATEISLSGRQIEVVSEVLDALGWRLSRFTSREPRRERDEILTNFRLGIIDAMVAIKCLDEGIDVPACRTAYIIASSKDPRQFIQRRGRILRKSPGKDVATIHDFIVVLPDGANDETGYAKRLIASELQRVAEFAGLARNRFKAYESLRPVLLDYGLEHAV